MKTLRVHLKIHRIAYALAALIGAVYVSHHFFISAILSDRNAIYAPVTPAHNYDEALYYGPRAQSAYLGNLLVGDISTYEHKNSQAFLPLLNPLLLGWLGWLVGSLKSSFIVSDFLFPALIFLVVYFLILEISARASLALIGSAIFMFVPRLGLILTAFSKGALQDLWFAFMPWLHQNNELYFSRFEYPKTTYFFYVLAILFIFRALIKSRRQDQILAGIFFGLVFYTYFFDWVALTMSLFIMGVIFLAAKKYREFKKILIIGTVGICVAIPYWVNFFKLRMSSEYQDIFLRLGVELARQFRFASVWMSYVRIALLVSLLLLLWRRKRPVLVIFLAALLGAYFLVVNTQIISGFNLQPDHWYRTQFLPAFLAVILIGIWLYEHYFVKYRFQTLIAGWFLIMFLIFGNLYGQRIFSITHAENYNVSKPAFASYVWLNNNTPQNTVVGTMDTSINSALLLNTHNKIFLASGLNTVASMAEIWNRFLILGHIFNMTPSQWRTLAVTSNTYLFTDYYRDHSFDSYFRNDAERAIPKNILDAETKRYEDFSKAGIKGNLPYRLDYLYFGTYEKSLNVDIIKAFPDAQKVYDQDGIIIYKL